MNDPGSKAMKQAHEQPIEHRVVIVVGPQRWRALAHETRPAGWSIPRSPWAALLIVGLLSLPALGSSSAATGLPGVADAAPTLATAASAPAPALIAAAAPQSESTRTAPFGAWIVQAIDDPADRRAVTAEGTRPRVVPDDVYELPPVIEGAVMIEQPPIIEGAMVVETWSTRYGISLTALDPAAETPRRMDDCLAESSS